MTLRYSRGKRSGNGELALIVPFNNDTSDSRHTHRAEGHRERVIATVTEIRVPKWFFLKG